MRCYLPVIFTTYRPGGAVDTVQTRYYAYDSGRSCAQAQADFSALSPDQKLARTALMIPTSSLGWDPRSCGTGGANLVTDVSSDDDTDLVNAPGNVTNVESDDNTDEGTPPAPNQTTPWEYE